MSSRESVRFRATIHKQGPNPYVDVPERVTKAFRDYARSGRVAVEGTLDRTPVRATCVPAGKGRQRLFVNGGMRAAAGVGVGDTVSFVLRPLKAHEVAIPADLADALRRVKGAKAAFDALPPSHRRELIRHVDDAKTSQTRKRRLARTADHVLGRNPPRERGKSRLAALWTCPECGNRFVNRNQYHSCKRYRLSDPFRGKPALVRRLFDRLRRMIEANGPVTVVPQRDLVAFMVHVRFVRAIPRQRWLDVGLWLTRRIEDRRFHKVETIGPDTHLHLLRVTRPEELDRRVAAWLREAYRIGCREHLGQRPETS